MNRFFDFHCNGFIVVEHKRKYLLLNDNGTKVYPEHELCFLIKTFPGVLFSQRYSFLFGVELHSTIPLLLQYHA